MDKETHRNRIRRAIEALGAAALMDKSRTACQNLCSTSEFQQAKVVMIFLSLPNEVDTSTAVVRAFEDGKTLVVPKVLWRPRRLVPVILASLDCPMKVDSYGLREPIGAETISPGKIDLVVTPGLAFDRSGRRLGRGGGFYDRFLKTAGLDAPYCGLALEAQVTDSVPVEQHDVALDMLVTDSSVRHFNGVPRDNRRADS